MDRPVGDRGADTIMLEIKKIVDCLARNGYEFQETKEAIVFTKGSRYIYEDDAIADFKKQLEYHDVDGNADRDSDIKVSIHFPKRADYTNLKKNKHGDYIYVGDPDNFIISLIEETPDSTEETPDSTGGTRRKNRKTCIKTRRNKRKSLNRRRK